MWVASASALDGNTAVESLDITTARLILECSMQLSAPNGLPQVPFGPHASLYHTNHNHPDIAPVFSYDLVGILRSNRMANENS